METIEKEAAKKIIPTKIMTEISGEIPDLSRANKPCAAIYEAQARSE